MARALHGLAQLLAAQGRDEEAEETALRVLQIRGQAKYETHPDLAESLHVLAKLYCSQGRDKEAKPLYLQALTIYEQTMGHAHARTQAIREEYLSLQ